MAEPRGKYYVVGGRQRKEAFRTDEWHQFERALVVEVDAGGGTARVVHEYVSPPEAVTDQGLPSILFKAGTLEGDRLYLCTQTEVLVYRVPGFELLRYLSLPCFNDLHHVRPTAAGDLLIANTGLDMVVEVAPDDRVKRQWSAIGEGPWDRFDRRVDYRRLATTKPHACHPNYVFELDGEVWVTRFEQKDALCLTAGGRIPIDVERPHDGVPIDRGVWFTTVDGHLLLADPRSGAASSTGRRLIDLNAVVGSPLALGWCRGLLPVGESHMLVGFSRLRPTRFRENVRWIKHRLGLRDTPGNLPTRVACFEIDAAGDGSAACRFCWERDLEELGLSVIFSIHRVPA